MIDLSLYQLKGHFQSLLRPMVAIFSRNCITPNQVTIATILLCLIAGMATVLWVDQKWPLLVLPLIFFVRMVLNAADGMLAKDTGLSTRRGVILNELGDVVSDIACYLPMAMVHTLSAVLIVGVVILALLAEFTGVIPILVGQKRQYDGPMGKSDRALWMGVVAILAFLELPGIWLNSLLVLVLMLLVLTIANRFRHA